MVLLLVVLFSFCAEVHADQWASGGASPGTAAGAPITYSNGDCPRCYAVDIRFAFSPDSTNTMSMQALPEDHDVNVTLKKFRTGSPYESTMPAQQPKGHVPVIEHIDAPNDENAIQQACQKYPMGIRYEKTVNIWDCKPEDAKVEHHNDFAGTIKIHSCTSKHVDPPPPITGFILRKGSSSSSPILCGFGNKLPQGVSECDCPPPVTS